MENNGKTKAPPSRQAAYRNAYHRACYGTVSACLPAPEKEAFKRECEKIGKTQHAVLCDLVAEWMLERRAFGNDGPPVIFG